MLAVVLAVGWRVRIHDPLAPRSLRMASGQPNSTLEAIAGQYAALLAKHGVRVEIVPSKGAIDSRAMLASGKIDVAPSQGGAAEGRDGRAVYLASIGYQPLQFDVLLSYRYGDIFDLYRAAERATTREEIVQLRGSTEALRHRMESIWVPKGCFETFGRLLTAMDALVSRVDAVEARIREP